MFRGGDYIDNPKFYQNETYHKNSLDVSVSIERMATNITM